MTERDDGRMVEADIEKKAFERGRVKGRQEVGEGLRFGLRQAAAWRCLSEVVRRHPRLHVLEMHAGGGQYDELVLWDPRAGSTPVRCNYGGSIHLAPSDAAYEQFDWGELLASDPRDVIARIEAATRLGVPPAVPRSTPQVLTYRAIAHLVAAHAFDRWGLVMLNGVCDSSGMGGTGVREELFERFPSIHAHRRHATAGSPFGVGEYRFWFASLPGEGDVVQERLAFETTGHVWKAGPDVGDRFDLVRTYDAAGRDIARMMAEFDVWRARPAAENG